VTARAAAPGRSLKARAIAALARREYARAELRQKLLAAVEGGGERAAEIDAVLDELATLGYLSDARYAHAVVARKAGTHSRRAMLQALAARGVDTSAAHAAVAEAALDDDAALISLWRRRFGHAPVDEREKARQVRFLQSRGFALSAILRLLRSPPDATPDDIA